MDSSLLLDARVPTLCSMLFTTVVALTVYEPESVPGIFQMLWHRYRLFQETRRIRASKEPRERFWEIDMTKFEP